MSETIKSSASEYVPERRVDEQGNVHDRVTGWTTVHSLPGPDGQQVRVEPPIFIAPLEGSGGVVGHERTAPVQPSEAAEQIHDPVEVPQRPTDQQ